MAPKLEIITRAGWGARLPTCRVPVNWPADVDLWIHHTDGTNLPNGPRPGMSDAALRRAERATVQGIQHFHMTDPDHLWCDVGYAYLVAPSGRVYEGRGEARGAHSPENGKNLEPSCAMLGTYQDVEPSNEIHVAIYQLMDVIDAGDLRGHRENSQTDCPGDGGMRKIVNGPPPIPLAPDPVTLPQRLAAAGFGPKSVRQVMAQLALGHQGTIPRPGDSALFRRLRLAGLGVASARTVVKALRD
jgi:hypothetical protein